MNRHQRRGQAVQQRKGQIPTGEQLRLLQTEQLKQMRVELFNEACQARAICEVLVEEAEKIIGHVENDDDAEEGELEEYLGALVRLKLGLKGSRARVIQTGLEFLRPIEQPRIVEPTDDDVERSDAAKDTGLIVEP